MSTLHSYIPQDRLRALSIGKELPDRSRGAALFADISGFTPLTEKLTRELGPRRGSEELTRQINAVYDALIAEIEKLGGSVISFAGDAITCWFDGDEGLRAIGAALALQTAMIAFPQLGLKAAVTSGPVRRFKVGDPDVQWIDGLAGDTVARLARGEHLAARGEILVDALTAGTLAGRIVTGELREAENGDRFALALGIEPDPVPDDAEPTSAIDIEMLRPWILRPVFERNQSGHEAFLTELRPAAALFLRFSGIDYDDDEAAGKKLDLFVRFAQAMVKRFDGSILQVTIGDKGSYFYAVFGAPTAHEDDVRRAVMAALVLRGGAGELDFLEPIQIGIAKGTMRVGAYGGSTRCTYGALGDDVNIAARLMTTALPGEIVVSGGIQKEVESLFTFEARPPLSLKGKAEPLPIFAISGARQTRPIRLEEPLNALPIMGRGKELAHIGSKLDEALAGRGQLVGITAEAGLGKSRLAAEVIRLANHRGFTGYGGTCEASGSNTPLLVWKPVWQAFFDVDPSAPLRRQIRNIEGEIEDWAPSRVDAIPLLSPLLDLPIEDGEFTSTLEPKERKNVLFAILEECLRSAATEGPILLVLEDLHWMDPLSAELLVSLSRVAATLPVCIVMAYRPSEHGISTTGEVESMPHFTRVGLEGLKEADAVQLIRAKLAQLFPSRVGALPEALSALLIARAEGNPFYLEELLSFLRDRNIDPFEERALGAIELPASLHALILSRVDRLSEAQKAILKTASVIGRSFPLSWLEGSYAELGDVERIRADLAELGRLDLTPLDKAEPDVTYLFKHMITKEVAYESISYAQRASLHERLASFIEGLGISQHLPLIAWHYGLSENLAKRREFFGKAGEAALAACSYGAAVEWFSRLIPLVEDEEDRMGLFYKVAEGRFRLGRYTEAREAIDEALKLTTAPSPRAAALALLAEITSQGAGDYIVAKAILAEALPLAREGDDPRALGRVLYALGDLNWRLGSNEEAGPWLEECVEVSRAAEDTNRLLFALNRRAYMTEDLTERERCFRETIELATAVGNRERMMAAYNNLAAVADERKDYSGGQDYLNQALCIAREIGARSDAALFLLNLGFSHIQLNELSNARSSLMEGITIAREMESKPWVMAGLAFAAALVAVEGGWPRALALLGLCQSQSATSRDIQNEIDKILARCPFDVTAIEDGLAQGRKLDIESTLVEVLANLARNSAPPLACP